MPLVDVHCHINHEMFKEDFTHNIADGFYDNIRCGLLHEGTIKKNYRIRLKN